MRNVSAAAELYRVNKVTAECDNNADVWWSLQSTDKWLMFTEPHCTI